MIKFYRHLGWHPLIHCCWGVTVIAFGLVAYLVEGWIFWKEVFLQIVSGGIAVSIFCDIIVPFWGTKEK